MEIKQSLPRQRAGAAVEDKQATGFQLSPAQVTFLINPDRVTDVLRKRALVTQSLGPDAHVGVDIRNDGTVTITADNPADIVEAHRRIKLLATEPFVGSVHEGTVRELIEFCGAVVELNPWHRGLLHLSKIPVSDQGSWTGFLESGQRVKVTVIGKSVVGQLQLSMLDFGPTQGAV